MEEPAAPQADAPVASMAVEDNSQQPSPVAEPTTSVEAAPEGAVEDAPINEPTAAEPQTETEHQPSRLERRIEQVETKAAALTNLSGQLRGLQGEQQVTVPIPGLPPQAPKLSELLADRESIDPQELDKLGQQVYESAAQATKGLNSLEVQQLRHELTQQRAVDEIEKQASILPTQYEELNPDSPKYNPILEQKIEAAFKARAVVNNPYNPSIKMIDPNVRLADVAKDYVEVARAAVEQGKAQTSASLATQVDQSAVTPTSDSPAVKSVEEMTLAEHEAYLKAKGYFGGA